MTTYHDVLEADAPDNNDLVAVAVPEVAAPDNNDLVAAIDEIARLREIIYQKDNKIQYLENKNSNFVVLLNESERELFSVLSCIQIK